jgi:prephenate dehydratase
MKVEKNSRVAFQGERGAFSEEAALMLLGGEIRLVPCTTLATAFRAVPAGDADYVLAPVENSLAGAVQWSLDLLAESELAICAEVILPIVHNLIAVPGARIEQIRSVESHPVGLAQCERFFHANPLIKRIAAEDTAGSVREIVSAGDPARAAIAGRRAAEIYGGEILREHLEDNPANFTRFFLLAAAPQAASAGTKLSLVFQLPHLPGALYTALEPFARREINLLKIESRPIQGRPWEYRFYLDLQASLGDLEVLEALKELEQHAVQLKILGCYDSVEITGTQTKTGAAGA